MIRRGGRRIQTANLKIERITPVQPLEEERDNYMQNPGNMAEGDDKRRKTGGNQ